MKKLIILTCLLVTLFPPPKLGNAQLLGRWVIPTGTENIPHEVLVLEFMENDLIQSSIMTLPSGLILSADQIGDGAFNSNYELDYCVVSDYLFYDSEYTHWNQGALGGFVSEFEITPRPQNPGDYYMIYCEQSSDKNLETWIRMNHVWFEDDEYHIGPDQSIVEGIYDGSSAAFALTEIIDGSRKIYTASHRWWTDYIDHPASLRYHTITENGVDNNTFVEIITSENSSFDQADFISYNLELKVEENDSYSIAWFNQNDATKSTIYLVIDGDEDEYNINKGRIGGIEFSSLETNVLYVSCHDEGIIKMDYFTGNYLSTLSGSSNYGHTFLQTAPDGHIYAVSDDGSYLGRINQQDGLFYPEVFQIPEYTVATYREFDNNRYYILPENHRTYDPLIVTVETENETCPGYGDGSAEICVSGGTPGVPPDPEYTIICNGPQGLVTNITYDPDSGCFYLEKLSAGYYTFEITDGIGTYYAGGFTIEEYEYDLDFVEIGYSMPWSPQYPSHCKIESGILIKSGATLTIDNAILEFGPQGKIWIEPGGKIISQNTTYTNLDCEPFQKWKGIEVWGIQSEPQRMPDGSCPQGVLEILNCTIEHAENGVLTCNPLDPINPWRTSGGIVKAYGSTFSNNTKAAHFIPYQNYQIFPGGGTMPRKNMSYFKHCIFSLDQDYITNATFWKHVDLHGVNGIDFVACDFSLNATIGVSEWNNGIASYSAGFTVEADCDQPVVPCPDEHINPCTFNGFYRAVSVHNGEVSDFTYEIRDAEYANNTIGVYSNAVNFGVITDCYFDIGKENSTSGECSNPYGIGIDMQFADGFAIENNDFEKFSSAPTGEYTGVRVFRCPSDHDVIYNNRLEGLSYGNYAFGINRKVPGEDQDGVEYQCNKNFDNAIDFIVTAEPNKDGSIRTYHGTPEISSGNTFSLNPGPDEWHFRNEKYQNIDWFYYEPIDEEEPEKVFTLPEIYFTAIYQDVGYNNCPDHYGGGGGIGINTSTRQQLELDFIQNLNDYNAVKSLYESYIDGGSTDAELLDIQTAQPNDMWALREQLLGDSPHLSQEVLREMAERTDVFPDDVIFDILAANPDELSRDSLLLFLEQKENPLPQYMIAILEQLVANVTYKTILERQMAEYHAAKVQAAQDIIRSIVHDSIFDATDYRNWLSNLESLEADKKIVSSYVNEEDYAAATSLLNMMASLYELSGDRLQQYNDYKDLMLLQISWKQDGRNVFHLDSTELAILGAYTDNSQGHAQSIAQNILSQVNNTHYHECLYSDESIPLKQNRTIPLDGFNDLAGPKVNVEPNPASTWAAFNYELKGNSPTATLQIVNAGGKVIHHASLNGNQGQYVWDIRNVKSGVYLYIVTASGLTTTGKLIIK